MAQPEVLPCLRLSNHRAHNVLIQRHHFFEDRKTPTPERYDLAVHFASCPECQRELCTGIPCMVARGLWRLASIEGGYRGLRAG